MSRTGPLTLTSTNSEEFRARGELRRFKRWLAEVRPDQSTDARRQVAFYARRLLDALGDDGPALVAEAPDRAMDRLARTAPADAGVARLRPRCLRRAAGALHAAVHDHDHARTVALMDCRPRARARAAAAAAGTGNAPGGLAAAPRDADAAGTGAPPAAPASPALPPELRQLAESASHALTLKMRLEDSVDVGPVLRGMLGGFSPETRVRLANALPGAARRPVAVRAARSATSLVEVADAALVATLAARHVDVREAPEP